MNKNSAATASSKTWYHNLDNKVRGESKNKQKKKKNLRKRTARAALASLVRGSNMLFSSMGNEAATGEGAAQRLYYSGYIGTPRCRRLFREFTTAREHDHLGGEISILRGRARAERASPVAEAGRDRPCRCQMQEVPVAYVVRRKGMVGRRETFDAARGEQLAVFRSARGRFRRRTLRAMPSQGPRTSA